MERGETPNSGPPIAAAMGKSQGEATRQKRRKKKPKPDHAGLGVAPSQSPHAPNPLPAATFLQTQTQSPAPGTPILEEAAAVRKRKAAEGDKHGEEPMLAATTTKKKHKERRSSPSLSAAAAAAAAKEPILQQGTEVNTKRKRNKEEGPSKPLSTARFLEDPAQSPALGAQILEEATTEAAMRKRKMREEKRVAVLPFAQNQEQMEEHVLAVTMKKKKHKRKERKSSPSLTAAEAPILQQEAKMTKKRLPLDPTQAQSQGTEAPHASKPLSAATFLEAPTQPPASRTPMLEEAAVAVMSERKVCKEQKVAALPLSQNTTLEEPVLATTMMKKKKHKERKSSPPLTAAAAAEAPILQQEAKVTKKRLPLDPTQAQSQGTKASHASKPLSAATFLEAPTQPPASRTPMLEEATVAVMSERKICKEQKAVALLLSQNTTLEEPVLATTMMKKKKHKERKSSPSLTAAAAAEAPIFQQEAKVTKKWKRRKEEGPSTYSPLQLDPGLTQSEGTKVPHASKPLPAATFFEDPAQYTAPRAPMLEEAAAVMSKRKICKEQKVAAVCLAQNTILEEQRDDTMAVKVKESKHMKHTLSSISASAASETTIWEQKVKVTKKQKQRKQQEPSGKSPLSLHPGQTHSAQSQGGKAPPEQEQEADARKGSSINKSNGKMPCVHVLSKRKLIKEASKRQPALPEGFVPFSDFVSSCTEQNPDDSLPYSAFFDQFRYNPVCGDHKPPLPRTPDRLARLLPRANGTSKASKTNNSVVCKSKKKDSGPGSASGSQEKLHPQEKKNSEKMGTKKQRQPPPLLTRAEKCSDIYRRVPLDQLVPPPRSPHNLLQEKYASDPWKVIVICMLLNLTQGKQVKNIIEGFFECYPDAHSAVNADPEKMAGYLAYLGLQRVKTTRIQKFSKEYVEKEWTYITELCGVGKYAADAYAIFCAGRAIEVVPKDHKLVDYWKYVCFELPLMQKSQNAQEAGVQEQELAVMR
ncbi:hypothetical protein ACQ4PT_055921 [Festuca glaucescens]